MTRTKRRVVGEGSNANPFVRYYAPHRRAWTPSLWPPAIVSGVTVLAFTTLSHPGILPAIVLGVVLGFTTGWMRWALWRRRHPIIPLDEYITDLINEQRRSARWN